MAGKGKGRGEAEKARDRRIIAKLYLEQQLTQAEIAEKLNLSQATVSRDIKAIQSLDESDTREAVKKWRERSVATLSWVEDQAKAGWETSRQKVVTTKEIIYAKKDDLLPGDPAFLKEIRGAVLDMWKVMGFEKLSIGTDNDQEVNIQITVAPVAPRPKPGADGSLNPT